MIELTKAHRTEAVASIRQYAEANLPEPMGELAAGLLLDFLLEEIGPLLYNKGVEDAGTRLSQRLDDLPGELHEDAFGYWARQRAKRRR